MESPLVHSGNGIATPPTVGSPGTVFNYRNYSKPKTRSLFIQYKARASNTEKNIQIPHSIMQISIDIHNV